MEPTTLTEMAPPRIVEREPFLVFGLSQTYNCNTNSAIPSQWDRFSPHFNRIPGQTPDMAYGVIYNFDKEGNFDFMCGVEVAEFPADPPEFAKLRIEAQTYAVFEHNGHISSIGQSWDSVWKDGLKTAGLQAAEAPAFEQYNDKELDKVTGNWRVELWVPVKR